MVDNTVLNSGTGGDTIATDDIGGVKHQLVKVEFGAADSATQVSAAAPLPVDGSNVTQPVSGTVTANLSATDNAVLDTIDAVLDTINAKLVSGTDIGDVTVNNAAGSPVLTAPDNTVSTNNSSTATLGSGAAFTGTGDDVLDYGSVAVTLDASHDSAADGMTFQFSTDNSNWDDVYPHTYTAADGARRFQFPVTARYFRVVYTNGGTGQTHFRLQTILHRQKILTSIHRLVSDTDPDRSAQLVKSAIIAQASGSGDFVAVAANAQGKLQVAAEIEDGGNSITVDGSVSLAAAIPAGTNNIGDVDVASIAAGSNLVGDVGLSGARTAGGTTAYRNVDVDETEDEVKGSAGQVYWIQCVTIDATPVYLHLYNATAASVTVGTTTPLLTFLVPTSGDSNGAGFALSVPNGIEFDTAITVAATTTVGGSTGPGLNEVILAMGYA